MPVCGECGDCDSDSSIVGVVSGADVLLQGDASPDPEDVDLIRRGIDLPDQLAALLVAHKATQDREREFVGTVWQDGDWMFAQPDGRPIDPRSDWEEWKNLLIAAHVRDGRLHDARHTAATVLLVLGVPTRAVEYFMGWSNGTMARRYQHVVEALKRDIADQINGYLWAPKADGSGDQEPPEIDQGVDGKRAD